MTLTLAEVRDWLKGLNCAERYYIGSLDRKQLKSLGVYSRARTGTPAETALGGQADTRTGRKQISLLLHWTNNARETEQAALALYDALGAAFPCRIGNATADYARLLVSEPVDVGADDGGIYERVIWLDIYYQK